MTVCDRGSETHSPERKFPGANAPLGGGLTAARELGKAAPVGAGAARDGFGFRAAFGRPQLRQAGRSSSAPRFLCVQNGGAYRSTPSSRCGSREAGPCGTRRPRGRQARCPRLRPRPRAPGVAAFPSVRNHFRTCGGTEKRRKRWLRAAQAPSDAAGAEPRRDPGSSRRRADMATCGRAIREARPRGEGSTGGGALAFPGLSGLALPSARKRPELAPKCAPRIPYPVRFSSQKGPLGR